MRIIYNNVIPPKGYAAINLFGTMFARKGANITEITINHESIHTAQMKEMLYVPFYMWYAIEFLVKLCLCRNWKKAYRAISLEREAYGNQADLEYLGKRKRYAWIKLVKTS